MAMTGLFGVFGRTASLRRLFPLFVDELEEMSVGV